MLLKCIYFLEYSTLIYFPENNKNKAIFEKLIFFKCKSFLKFCKTF